jgi:hypothetical protein
MTEGTVESVVTEKNEVKKLKIQPDMDDDLLSGFLSEEEDEKSYNRIMPRALNGRGIPVILNKLPKLVEMGKDDKKWMAIAWEFYEVAEQAFTKQNIALPLENVDVITEQDKSRQSRATNQLKHLLGAFINFGDIPAVSYRDFAEKALARFTEDMIGTKAEIKLIYSDDNKFTQFPLYPNFISTAKKKKTLETDPNNKYDKVVKTKSTGGAMSSNETDVAKYNDMV